MPNIAAGKDCQMKVDDESTYAAARNSSVAENINTTVQKVGTAVKASANSAGNKYDCYRSFFAFDTSGVSIAPASATLKLYGYQYGSADVIIIKVDADATGDSDTDFVVADFSKTGTYDASTAYSAQVSTWSTTNYNEITLNATALSDMASLSEFKLALIEHDYDYSKTAPANSVAVKSGIHYSNATSSDVRPTISYVAGSANTPNDIQKRVKTKGGGGKGFSRKFIKAPTSGGKTVSNGFKIDGF